ncbi:MAG: ketopantoate reductase family protein [Actinomycetaceae bacterium]
MTRYIVIGAGAVGGALAATLHEAGRDVLLVARGAALDAVRARGLRYTRPGGTTDVPVAVVGHPEEVTLTGDDRLVLATKTQDAAGTLLDWARRPVRLAGRTGTAAELPVLTLQNGLETERLALRLFRTVVGVTTLVPGLHLSPGEIVTGAAPKVGRLYLGSVPAGAALPDGLVDDLRAAGWLAQAVEDVRRWKAWKLLHNVGNATELLAGTEAELAGLVARVVAEAEEVLAAARQEVADPAREREVDDSELRIDPGTGYGPGQQSTWQSFVRGRPSEVDYLNGEVTLLGRLHGVPTPVNTALQTLLGISSAAGEAPGTRTAAELEQLVAHHRSTDTEGALA